jgi:hypothetical protein
VYELYGLTEEEIAIVEGRVRVWTTKAAKRAKNAKGIATRKGRKRERQVSSAVRRLSLVSFELFRGFRGPSLSRMSQSRVR